MNELEKARSIINEVDAEMAVLWEKRMKAVEMVVQYKMEHGLPVFDGKREKEVIERNAQRVHDEHLKAYYIETLQMMMDISKKYQKEIMER
ncbi:MAG: chorismate mutase [Erysipelotrichaceae bacterium]|nr:chorismate mutase [Erysipelotrichaceae bacterium]MBQ7889954.1 chorismate mutase [Erysipelotrichaceae bacterium]